jgi:hypothetical protein
MVIKLLWRRAQRRGDSTGAPRGSIWVKPSGTVPKHQVVTLHSLYAGRRGDRVRKRGSLLCIYTHEAREYAKGEKEDKESSDMGSSFLKLVLGIVNKFIMGLFG